MENIYIKVVTILIVVVAYYLQTVYKLSYKSIGL